MSQECSNNNVLSLKYMMACFCSVDLKLSSTTLKYVGPVAQSV